ncbi:hypothetical protein CTA1_5615 [Colletotrichum tanaceti]|uniref:Rhodopsin domain-containing protein n=1 Tax=Colletotrichum tanaceti TaxID=1306861 RepID=A0A4U6XG69_9PEZI|nr:hypothetical protein CTA1_5615 [Colletotrichum tanaceti]
MRLLLVVLLVTTALRLWARAGCRNLGWDDYTIAAAALSATVRYAFGVMQLPHGNGRHRVYLTNHEYTMINMYGWWGQLFHFTSMAFLKVSLALLILRIKSNGSLNTLLYAVIVGSLIINFAVVIILLAECRPAGFWRGKNADCWPNTIRIYAIWVSIGDYCMTAIWSNLELFLGISAANIALSRAVYTYFFPSSSDSRPSGNGYFHSGLRSDRFEIPATMVSSGRLQGSAARSSNSDIPLEPGIQKKTEFWRREDGRRQRTPESV